nr:MAG TPA: hypothetical protein [Caudoviricetes sp.]
MLFQKIKRNAWRIETFILINSIKKEKPWTIVFWGFSYKMEDER